MPDGGQSRLEAEPSLVFSLAAAEGDRRCVRLAQLPETTKEANGSMGRFQTAAEGRALVEWATQRWNVGDLDGYFEGYAPDVRCDLNGLELRGVDALRSFYATALAAFPDLRIELTHVVADPESQTVATMQVETGTHTGDLVTPHGSIPATGREFTMHGAMVLHFDADGRVEDMIELVDRSAFAELAAPDSASPT